MLLKYENEYDNSEKLFVLGRFNEVLIGIESEDKFKNFKNNYMNNIDLINLNVWGVNILMLEATDL